MIHPTTKDSEIATPDIPVGIAMTHRELPQKYRARVILSLSKDDRGDLDPSVTQGFGDCRATPAFLQVRSTADMLAMTHRELPQKYQVSVILSLSKDDTIMIHPTTKDSEIATAFAMLKLRNDASGVSPLTSSNHLSTELRH